jgi:hypothetical protein
MNQKWQTQTSHKEKTKICFQYFHGLIGLDEQQTLNFDVKENFRTPEHCMELDNSISEQEIIHAINSCKFSRCNQHVSGTRFQSSRYKLTIYSCTFI